MWLSREMLPLHVIAGHKNTTFILGTEAVLGHCSHVKLENPILSELGHLCLAFLLQTTHSGNLFAAFVALLRKRTKAARNISITKQKKTSRSVVENWFRLDYDVRKQKGSSCMISRWCRWIRYCRTEGVPKGSRLSSSLEICAISASCSSWVFWKSVARALEWSNSCMFGSLTRLGHFWELQKAFAQVHDTVPSCIYNKRSAKQCDGAAVDFAIVYQGISWYIIIGHWYCCPARHIGFSGFGKCQKDSKSAKAQPIATSVF